MSYVVRLKAYAASLSMGFLLIESLSMFDRSRDSDTFDFLPDKYVNINLFEGIEL